MTRRLGTFLLQFLGALAIVLGLGLGGVEGALAQTDPCSGSSTGPCAYGRADLDNLTFDGYITWDWPDGAGGDISYGGTALGVSEDGDYIYISCNQGVSQRGIAKLALPATLNGTTGSPYMSVSAPCAGPTYTDLVDLLPAADGGVPLLGGLLELNGDVTVSGYWTYDASDDTLASHWHGASLSSFSGPFYGTLNINPYSAVSEGTGLVKNQMSAVPSEWVSMLGGTAIATSGYTSIISRQSYGASAVVFDPDDVTADGFSMFRLLGCGHTESGCNTYQNDGAANGGKDRYQGAELSGGAFIIPGTRTYAVIEREADGPACYGYGTSVLADHGLTHLDAVWCYSLSDPFDKGPKGYPYTQVAKLYDLKDMWDVKQGTKNVWDVFPYDVVTLPTSTASAFITNGVYNPVRQEYYLLEGSGGGDNAMKVISGWGEFTSGGSGVDEQIFGPFANGAACTVSTGYDASATSIDVSSGCGARFPTPGSDGIRAVWFNGTDYPGGFTSAGGRDPNYEVVTITAKSTDTFTITRAQEGTSASTKNTSAKTYWIIAADTAAALNTLDTANDASFVTLGTNSGMPNERVLTGTTNEITITDGGAGSTVTISLPAQIKITGTAARSTTDAVGGIDLFNGTAPVGTLTNGVSIYSASGEMRVMDAAGNSTLLSPHDDETGEVIFFSQNTVTGRVFRADVEEMYRKLDEILGGGHVTTFTGDPTESYGGGAQGRVIFRRLDWWSLAPVVAAVRPEL